MEDTRSLASWTRTEAGRVMGATSTVKRARMEEEERGRVNSMRVTVPSRQFVTQEIESESVTLRLTPGVEERESVSLKLGEPVRRGGSGREG